MIRTKQMATRFSGRQQRDRDGEPCGVSKPYEGSKPSELSNWCIWFYPPPPERDDEEKDAEKVESPLLGREIEEDAEKVESELPGREIEEENEGVGEEVEEVDARVEEEVFPPAREDKEVDADKVTPRPRREMGEDALIEEQVDDNESLYSAREFEEVNAPAREDGNEEVVVESFPPPREEQELVYYPPPVIEDPNLQQREEEVGQDAATTVSHLHLF